MARGPIVKSEEEPGVQEEPEVQEEEEEEADPSEIGEAAGVLTEQIIGTLTGSAQDVIQLFQEVVTSVGGVLEEVTFEKLKFSNDDFHSPNTFSIFHIGFAPKCLEFHLHCNLVPTSG